MVWKSHSENHWHREALGGCRFIVLWREPLSRDPEQGFKHRASDRAPPSSPTWQRQSGYQVAWEIAGEDAQWGACPSEYSRSSTPQSRHLTRDAHSLETDQPLCSDQGQVPGGTRMLSCLLSPVMGWHSSRVNRGPSENRNCFVRSEKR